MDVLESRSKPAASKTQAHNNASSGHLMQPQLGSSAPSMLPKNQEGVRSTTRLQHNKQALGMNPEVSLHLQNWWWQHLEASQHT